MDWQKGAGASDRVYYEVAAHPAIVDVVTGMLGGNVMLWGGSIQTQRAGANHPWHSDIETSGEGQTVSVWIGLEQASSDSGLQFISHTHHFTETIQQMRGENGVSRADTTADALLAWARERDSRAQLMIPATSDGQALFFQGRLWHHSANRGGQTRRALLLQYATPETVIRIPDLNYLDWPFRSRDFPKPPCIMIRGTDTTGVNRIVSGPAPAAKGRSVQLSNLVSPLQLPLAPDDTKGFRPYAMFEGSTPDLIDMEAHVSVLNQHQCPHPPHTHREEEILILLSGEADVLLPQVKGLYGDERHPLRPGEFVYYPSMFPHTLRTTSVAPANYLMFKWYAEPQAGASMLSFGHYSAFDPSMDEKSGQGFRPRTLFEGSTLCLRKLHCHVSILEPGAGYAPHADAYDVAIIMLEGEIETLDQRVSPHAVVYHPAGQMHGIHNPGTVRARYIVFEFHGSQAARSEAFPKPPPTFMKKLTDPSRWKRKARHVANKLRGR